MERVCVGEKADSPSSLQGKNDPGDLLVLCEDVIPDGDKLVEGNSEVESSL